MLGSVNATGRAPVKTHNGNNSSNRSQTAQGNLAWDCAVDKITEAPPYG